MVLFCCRLAFGFWYFVDWFAVCAWIGFGGGIVLAVAGRFRFVCCRLSFCFRACFLLLGGGLVLLVWVWLFVVLGWVLLVWVLLVYL